VSKRRLIVMRHAKAEPYASTDQARELTDRGRAQAAAAGRHLAGTGAVPDHAVVSPAARAVGTWEAAAEELPGNVEVEISPSVYTGGPEVVLEVLRQVPEDATTVMYVGHNPTASYLCHLLDDGEGDPEALHGLLRGFPTGAVATFEVDVPWADLGEETGRVLDFFAAD
jgi:phosphohistidine phosphatase